MTDPYNIRWKKGDLIRHIATGKPMLVIDVANRLATIVVDLEDKRTPTTTLVILMKDYQDWSLDTDMECTVKKNDMMTLDWKHNPITL